MKPCPKPSRKDRKKYGEKSRAELLEYRKSQYQIARDRDDGYCVFCWFWSRIKTKANDVHHVYGRGKYRDSWREQYVMMLCTCRKHHPPAIHGGPNSTLKLIGIEKVLIQANETPINPRFRHESQSNT